MITRVTDAVQSWLKMNLCKPLSDWPSRPIPVGSSLCGRLEHHLSPSPSLVWAVTCLWLNKRTKTCWNQSGAARKYWSKKQICWVVSFFSSFAFELFFFCLFQSFLPQSSSQALIKLWTQRIFTFICLPSWVRISAYTAYSHTPHPHRCETVYWTKGGVPVAALSLIRSWGSC